MTFSVNYGGMTMEEGFVKRRVIRGIALTVIALIVNVIW